MFIKTILTNNTFIVILPDGEIFTSTGTNKELQQQILQAKTPLEVKQLMFPELYEKEKEILAHNEEVVKTTAYFDILKNTGDFFVKDDSVYVHGINRSMPKLLVDRIIDCLKTGEGVDSVNVDEYMSYLNFWRWCCLNPRAEVADNLFDFLERNGLRLNKQGYFFALRNVVKVAEDDTLTRFVSEQYNKIKAWKKNPEHYFVCLDDNGAPALRKEAELGVQGNLKELYLDLPNMQGNKYTDAHTGTFDIRIGVPVSMPFEECSYSTADCGHRGLHFCLHEINYVGCGDTSIVVLINPSKVVGIGESKGRCYEYLPVMTIPREEATTFLSNGEFDSLEIEEDYAKADVEGLEEKVIANFAAEVKKYSFNLTPLSTDELYDISANLKYDITERLVDSI